jgi:hypothetical protein
MRITEIISEAVGPNYLYHTTTKEGLLGMLRTGSILPSNPKIAHGWGFGGVGDHGDISMTRDPGYWAFGEITTAKLVLDREAIKQRLKMTPYGSRGEFEERVSRPIPFTNKFVKKVIFMGDDGPPTNWVKSKLRQLGIPFEMVITRQPGNDIKVYQQYR